MKKFILVLFFVFIGCVISQKKVERPPDMQEEIITKIKITQVGNRKLEKTVVKIIKKEYKYGKCVTEEKWYVQEKICEDGNCTIIVNEVFQGKKYNGVKLEDN